MRRPLKLIYQSQNRYQKSSRILYDYTYSNKSGLAPVSVVKSVVVVVVVVVRLRNPSRGNARSKKLSRTHQRELNYNCRVLNASLKSVVTSPQRFALARDHKSSFFCRVQTHDLFLRLISSSSRLILSQARD